MLVIIFLSLFVSLVLIIWGIFWLFQRMSSHIAHKEELRVVEFSGDKEVIKNIFKLLAPPFAMEIAVHQIGRDIHNYMIVPLAYLDKVVMISGGKEVKDYNIYHPGGVNFGYSLEISVNSSASLDAFLGVLNTLDFSKVDEIGEGAMFQLIFGEKPNGKVFIGSARILVSAPTGGQAQEIIASLRKGLSGCKWTEEKDRSFIDAATYRELGVHKGIEWTVS